MALSRIIDLTGQRFGLLVVQERGPNSATGGIRWHCLCDCGNTRLIQPSNLRNQISCGCEYTQRRGASRRTHGKSTTPEYVIYVNIKYRCTYPKNKAYANYGGRGIAMEWQSFEAFLADMGPRPSPKHMIERLDNDGPYSKANCVWATRLEQNNNKRSNHYIEHEGQRMTIAQLARQLQLPYDHVKNLVIRKGLFITVP